MPKKRDVASLVGNFSPVKRRSASFVNSRRHRSGDMGEELKSRAGETSQRVAFRKAWAELTFLKD